MSSPSAKPLWQKLQLRGGMTVRLLNPPDGARDWLGALPEDILLSGAGFGPCDAVLAFATSRADVAVLAEPSVKMLPPDGLLWFAWPKKTGTIRTDISRDEGWAALSALGLRPVRAISINERWSALRFRPKENVKSRPAPQTTA